jgi:cytidine deaminase
MLKATNPLDEEKLLNKIAEIAGGKEKLFEQLLSSAKEAMTKAYASYSKFRVGAALLTADGKIYSGCNVENASLPVGVCAEVCAGAKAVSEGSQKFHAVAVYCESSHSAWPCGRCRQFLSEFGGSKLIVITEGKNGQLQTKTMGELLPEMFGPGDMTDMLNSP